MCRYRDRPDKVALEKMKAIAMMINSRCYLALRQWISVAVAGRAAASMLRNSGARATHASRQLAFARWYALSQ